MIITETTQEAKNSHQPSQVDQRYSQAQRAAVLLERFSECFNAMLLPLREAASVRESCWNNVKAICKDPDFPFDRKVPHFDASALALIIRLGNECGLMGDMGGSAYPNLLSIVEQRRFRHGVRKLVGSLDELVADKALHPEEGVLFENGRLSQKNPDAVFSKLHVPLEELHQFLMSIREQAGACQFRSATATQIAMELLVIARNRNVPLHQLGRCDSSCSACEPESTLSAAHNFEIAEFLIDNGARLFCPQPDAGSGLREKAFQSLGMIRVYHPKQQDNNGFAFHIQVQQIYRSLHEKFEKYFNEMRLADLNAAGIRADEDIVVSLIADSSDLRRAFALPLLQSAQNKGYNFRGKRVQGDNLLCVLAQRTSQFDLIDLDVYRFLRDQGVDPRSLTSVGSASSGGLQMSARRWLKATIEELQYELQDSPGSDRRLFQSRLANRQQALTL